MSQLGWYGEAAYALEKNNETRETNTVEAAMCQEMIVWHTMWRWGEELTANFYKEKHETDFR